MGEKKERTAQNKTKKRYLQARRDFVLTQVIAGLKLSDIIPKLEKVDRRDNNTTRLGAIRRILDNIRIGGNMDKNTARIMTLGFTGIPSRLTEEEWEIFRFNYPESAAA